MALFAAILLFSSFTNRKKPFLNDRVAVDAAVDAALLSSENVTASPVSERPSPGISSVSGDDDGSPNAAAASAMGTDGDRIGNGGGGDRDSL